MMNGSRVSVIAILLVGVALALRLGRFLPPRLAGPVLSAYLGLFIVLYLRGYAHRGNYELSMTLTGLGAVALGFAAALALVESRPPHPSERWMILLFGSGFLVAFFSGAGGSADGWVEAFQRWFGVRQAMAEALVQITRKFIHFVFYGSMGVLAMGWALSWKRPVRAAFSFGLVWALTHGIFDEVRQSFHTNRTGSPFDVAINLAGILTLMAIYWSVLPQESSGKA